MGEGVKVILFMWVPFIFVFFKLIKMLDRLERYEEVEGVEIQYQERKRYENL